MNPTEEIRDLSSRLYYCSNSREGRKMRKWIEKRIRELEKKIDEDRLSGIESQTDTLCQNYRKASDRFIYDQSNSR